MLNFSRHAGFINISTMPTLPRHAGIFSNFSRHAGTITNFFPPCEIIFLKGHKKSILPHIQSTNLEVNPKTL
jgi:hypothetical protein